MNSQSQSQAGSVDIGPVDIIVPAAGKGQRMESGTAKQYLKLAGKPILQHTIETLLALNPGKIILVVAQDDNLWRDIPVTRNCHIVGGGNSRAESVGNGLKALGAAADDWVMVHDSVRPCVSLLDIQHLWDELKSSAVGGLLGIPVLDTLKKTGTQRQVTGTIPRQDHWLAQTPQMFRYGLLEAAMKTAQKDGLEVSDEASAVEHMGYHPIMVRGSQSNIKITTRQDLPLAEFYLNQGLSLI